MKTVAPPASVIAAAPPARPLKKLGLVGNLSWWLFRDTATDLAELARIALKVDYPTLFLPVPHPISSSVALRRALQRATANVPAGYGRWRGELLAGVATGEEVPNQLQAWTDELHTQQKKLRAEQEKNTPEPQTPEPHISEPHQGMLLRWEPERLPTERPWHVHLWAWLLPDEVGERLPLYERLRILMEIYIRREKPRRVPERVEWDATDSVVKTAIDPKAREQEITNILAQVKAKLQQSLSAVEERRLIETLRLDLGMGERLYSRLDEELYLATAPEIGDGVMAALEDVGGVKLRPGLFTVPGRAGIARAEATEKYLRRVGRTEAGRFDLYAPAAERTGTAGLVLSELEAEVRALHEEVASLNLRTTGIRALRTRWLALDGLEQRLQRNEPFLGEAVTGLRNLLEEARRELRQKAERKELAPEPGATAIADLRMALETLHDAARAQDRAELHGTEELLKPHQETARRLGVGDLLRRLRKLVAATLHARGETFRGGEEEARRRRRDLCDALAAAAADLTARLPERKEARV